MQCRAKNEKIGIPTAKNLRIAVIFFLLVTSCLGAQPGNPGQGNIPTGPEGPQGPQGNPGGGGGGVSSVVPGQKVTVNPGVNPKALVPLVARNATRLALGGQLTLSDLLTLRQILLERIGYGGREIGAWAAANGDFVKEEAQRVTSAGMIVAVDKRFCEHFVLGIVGGYSHSTSADFDADTGWGGVYGIAFNGPWYINQTLIGGGNTFRTTRIGPFGGIARGSSGGWFGSEITQGGYNYKCGSLTIGPYGLLQYALNRTNGWSESGSIAPVTVRSNTAGSIVSDLGVETSYDWHGATFKVSAAWEHEYSDTTTFTTVNIVDIPSSMTTVASPSLGHESAVIGAGIAYHLSKRITVNLGYNGQFGRRNYESNNVTGSIRIGF